MSRLKTVWVVEDNQIYSRALTMQLRAFGVSVVSVDNAKSALPQEGDIVLLDLMGTDSGELTYGQGVRVCTMSACADFSPNYVKPLSQRTLSYILYDGGDSPPANSVKINSTKELSMELMKKLAA